MPLKLLVGRIGVERRQFDALYMLKVMSVELRGENYPS
jgi:hypothetical protein